jgi:hypothetical protein
MYWLLRIFPGEVKSHQEKPEGPAKAGPYLEAANPMREIVIPAHP